MSDLQRITVEYIESEDRFRLIGEIQTRDTHDETPEADEALKAVLTNDPGTGVMRHADAGYPEAIACAKERGVDLPMG